MNQKAGRNVLLVIMDGIGVNPQSFGNAVALARRPTMRYLEKNFPYTTLLAHGTAVGLPSDADIGNSEVGHNAMGAGRIFDQGAKLVQQAIDNESIYSADSTWQKQIAYIQKNHGTLHFLGLLSDGNVHSHEQHLYSMLRHSKKSGIKKVRVHVLFDGRDVGEKSAEIYVDRLEKVMQELRSSTFDIQAASGGGRMHITMDRYEADWQMVERGWRTHVLGLAPHHFANLPEALKYFRTETSVTDQYIPAFTINAENQPIGRIQDGDGVIFFNFRGDRAIEITRAFTDENFSAFDRVIKPNIFYAGMMEYDGDLKIPNHFLVSPPAIDHTLGEHLAQIGLRQFACSETQKFGHVTYFWNGNRSGYFDRSTEEYVEVPSDNISFDRKPWMKAYEICEVTIDRMRRRTFDFGRINFANGDMVGHTGDLDAAVLAVETVDLMLRRLITTAMQTNTILLITADHGNADEMFDAKAQDYPHWQDLAPTARPRPKTAHTINPVPLYLLDPTHPNRYQLATGNEKRTLGNLANTILQLLEIPQRDLYLPSLLRSVP